jgi:hypothetical protein
VPGDPVPARVLLAVRSWSSAAEGDRTIRLVLAGVRRQGPVDAGTAREEDRR